MAETRKVTCTECHKRSEIMAPGEDHEGLVVWRCPQPREDGELCGSTNEVA